MTVNGSSAVSRFEQVDWGAPERFLGLLAVLIIGVAPAIRPLKEWMDADPGQALLLLSAATLWLFFFPFLIARMRGARGLLRPPPMIRLLREVVLAVPLTIVTLIIETIAFVGMTVFSGGPVEPVDSLGLRGIQLSPAIMLMLVFLLCVAVPLTEEVYFRGFLYPALKRRFPLWVAAVVQAALWSLLHEYPAPLIIALFLVGLFLAWIYEQRRTLVTPIAIHAMMNAFALLPALVLIAVNQHTPASDWVEAGHKPGWIRSTLVTRRIEIKDTAGQQRLWAVEHLGLAGERDWKAEIAALDTIAALFPTAEEEIERARLGLAEIYLLQLEDTRRGILSARRVSEASDIDIRRRIWALLLEAGGLFILGEEEDGVRTLDAAGELLTRDEDYPDLHACRSQLGSTVEATGTGYIAEDRERDRNRRIRRILQDYADYH
jgi:membrane protease YdiL (CAAX protease family)